MNLTELTQITAKSKKRVGRGHGSGRGKTSGRGTKGQLARNSSKLDFDGDANPLIRRLPFLRGKGRNKSIHAKPLIVNIGALNVMDDGGVVDIESLVKYRLVRPVEAAKYGVKILGDGEIQKKLIIKLPISKNAAKKIQKVGGSVG